MRANGRFFRRTLKHCAAFVAVSALAALGTATAGVGGTGSPSAVVKAGVGGTGGPSTVVRAGVGGTGGPSTVVRAGVGGTGSGKQ